MQRRSSIENLGTKTTACAPFAFLLVPILREIIDSLFLAWEIQDQDLKLRELTSAGLLKTLKLSCFLPRCDVPERTFEDFAWPKNIIQTSEYISWTTWTLTVILPVPCQLSFWGPSSIQARSLSLFGKALASILIFFFFLGKVDFFPWHRSPGNPDCHLGHLQKAAPGRCLSNCTHLYMYCSPYIGVKILSKYAKNRLVYLPGSSKRKEATSLPASNWVAEPSRH